MKTRDTIIALIREGIISQREIADKLGISAPAVSKHIKMLVLEGILVLDKHKSWTLKIQGEITGRPPLTQKQERLLNTIKETGSIKQAELAKILKVKASSVIEMVAILQAKGYIVCENNRYSAVNS